jgi:hypothetical protein
MQRGAQLTAPFSAMGRTKKENKSATEEERVSQVDSKVTQLAALE